MTSGTVALQWLDSLEKVFDKAFVDLDLIFGDIDPEQSDLTFEARKKITILSSALAQMAQKSQTVFENNIKLEAQIVAQQGDLKAEIAEKNILEDQVQNLILQLHSAQLELRNFQSGNQDTTSTEDIKKKLNDELNRHRESRLTQAQLEAELQIVKAENADLKKYIFSVQGEVYGSRLAAKYLDKELAGRIQQIQLLTRKLPGPEHDRLWTTLESEIYLHRNKTVVRACKGRIKVENPAMDEAPEAVRCPSGPGFGPLRRVLVPRDPSGGLGMSVTGGREHGVPVIISHLHPNQAAHATGLLFVGDAILTVNGVDLRQKTHGEAVRLLCSAESPVELRVSYITVDSDSEEDSSTEYTDDAGYSFHLYDRSKREDVATNGGVEAPAPQTNHPRDPLPGPSRASSGEPSRSDDNGRVERTRSPRDDLNAPDIVVSSNHKPA